MNKARTIGDLTDVEKYLINNFPAHMTRGISPNGKGIQSTFAGNPSGMVVTVRVYETEGEPDRPYVEWVIGIQDQRLATAWDEGDEDFLKNSEGADRRAVTKMSKLRRQLKKYPNPYFQVTREIDVDILNELERLFMDIAFTEDKRVIANKVRAINRRFKALGGPPMKMDICSALIRMDEDAKESLKRTGYTLVFKEKKEENE